jgi:hypothetical protein
MRLIARLQRAEAGAAAARESKPAAVGLIWTREESVVDPETLFQGEYIACDIRIVGGAAVPHVGDPAAAHAAPGAWSMVERVTTDPQDLGWVLDAEGARVGRVMGIDGSMLSIEWLEAAELARAPVDELSPG